QGDDLVGARQSQVRTLAAGRARDIAAEQRNGAGIGCDLAGDQVEERSLASAVWADDEPTLAWLHNKVDIAGDAQAPERLAQRSDGERSHEVGSPAGRRAALSFDLLSACEAVRHRRT